MLPTRVLYYGKDEPLPQRVPLRAGPLTLIWEDGDLRYIKLGDREVLRRIYIATRDRNWGTVPNIMSDLQMEVREDSFHITYDVENRQNERASTQGGEAATQGGEATSPLPNIIDFRWHGEIVGETDGTIRFHMDGVARSTFMKNRIGFCILHPAEIAGTPARVEHTDGTVEEGNLPLYLVPDQPVLPFAEMRGLAHQVAPGIWAELKFAGDIFEMEDQRNWTDASYKTFCTPLSIPYPVEIAAGTRVQQSLTLALRPPPGPEVVGTVSSQPSAVGHRPLTFTMDASGPASKLPAIGLGVASHGTGVAALSEREIARLKALRLSHLRVDLRLAEPGYPAELRRAAAEARSLGVPLEVALLVTAENEDPRKGTMEQARQELRQLRAVLDEIHPPVALFLVYPAKEIFRGGTPVAEVLLAAHEHLDSYNGGARFGAGTNADYIFMVRSMPPLDQIDVLSFAICPQAHAFDNASVAETLGAQAYAVASARRLAGSVPVTVSPVTLKMRHNPYATGAVPPTPPGELPPQVDPRQMSLFAAGWTAGSIKYLAESGAASITYYETTGWRGVMETEAGSPLPEVFRSLRGAVFPMYHVFADVGEFAGGEVIPSRSSDPLKVDGLVLRAGGQGSSRTRVILANLTAEPLRVDCRGEAFPGRPIATERLAGNAGPLLDQEVRVCLLDETNVEAAMQAPAVFRAQPGELRQQETTLYVMEDGTLKIDLLPYAVARIDSTLERP